MGRGYGVEPGQVQLHTQLRRYPTPPDLRRPRRQQELIELLQRRHQVRPARRQRRFIAV